ncbi:response regulator transcription factor [Salirhabdus sp. Marseille-P4669]|uniref:response regulator transcription factor n=1 Tax=Salirhabdus sp. Marseille-P4669 TaxID=2042310 RepID=UPI000C7A5CB2|nr:response regulator transcription factor [Salirhabdus sp. Marseille-P4669]
MKQTLLVVDEENTRANYIQYLKEKGYHIIVSENGEDAKKRFYEDHPCLLLVDTVLSDMKAMELCKWVLSQERNEVSIILLSKENNVEEKILSLKSSADAYIDKNMEPEELEAHIIAVLRRSGQFCQKIAYGGLCIKPRKGEVLLFNEQVKLTKHEFNLLYHFMENPNVVLSRKDLMHQLYPYEDKYIMDRTIDAHIKKLREKIEDDPTSPKRILTVRGMGYKFIG